MFLFRAISTRSREIEFSPRIRSRLVVDATFRESGWKLENSDKRPSNFFGESKVEMEGTVLEAFLGGMPRRWPNYRGIEYCSAVIGDVEYTGSLWIRRFPCGLIELTIALVTTPRNRPTSPRARSIRVNCTGVRSREFVLLTGAR